MDSLLVSSALGVVWLVLLFGVCFLCVHIIRLAKLGRKYQKEKLTAVKTPPQQQEKAPPKDTGEPVYYIVEKKRRNKTSSGEPKRIQFK